MWKLSVALVAAAAIGLSGCEFPEEKDDGKGPKDLGTIPTPPEQVVVDDADKGMFKPLPKAFETKDNPLTEPKIALGRMLFYENRLSKNHDISCNSCHDLANYGVDGKRVSEGHKGQEGERNSPSVYNAAVYIAQFWDGRAATVEAQAKGPVLNPSEMAMPEEAVVVKTLKSMPGYVEAFKKAFPDDEDPVNFDNAALAIGAFERKLVTPSRFDAFLAGDDTALSNEEKKGLNLFVATGCSSCHNGVGVGGGAFQKLGAVKPWPDTTDLGRYKVTNADADKMMFRVPGLRNVEKTGPYFHDGKVKTLEEAVEKMAWHQLGKKLTRADVKLIVAFLKSMTGALPAEYIKKPALPESTDDTPEPDAS